MDRWNLITFSETTEYVYSYLIAYIPKCCCILIRVEFATLCYSEIVAYVKTGEPMDKSGAYGIQGIGGSLVKVSWNI